MATLRRQTFIREQVLICVLLLLDGHEGALETDEVRLHNDLFNPKTFKRDVLPVLNHSDVINVTFGFELVNIVEVSAKEQTLQVYGWIRQEWNNPLLRWNYSDYGGVKEIHIDPKEVWVPDILLYNNVDVQDRMAGGRSTFKTHVVIRWDGHCNWGSPTMLKSICDIDVQYFPFDTQECSLKFGSWTYAINRIDLTPMSLMFPTTYYMKNGEWAINAVQMRRNAEKYQCCRYEFVDITVTIKMARESLDYFITLIIPCCLISSMIFLGFILPPESGERIGLSITVMLAMTVFQQLTSALMPSYDFPLLGQYYFAIITEIGASVVVTTVILNFYHRTNRKMPRWLKTLIIDWMSRLVLLKDAALNSRPKRANKHTQKNVQKHGLGMRNSSFRASKKRINISDHKNPEFSDTIYEDPLNSDNNPRDSEMRQTGYNHNNSSFRTNFSYSFKVNLDNQPTESEENPTVFGEHGEELSEDELAERHWQWTLAAKILDRFFLWVAVVCGVVTVTAIFLRAPVLWKKLDEPDIDNQISVNL